MSYAAVQRAYRQDQAVLLRAASQPWGEIAYRLGYRTRSGAQRAVEAGVRRSGLLAGLRWVLAKRMTVLHPRLMAFEHAIDHADRDAYDEMEGESLLLMLSLTHACVGKPRPAGVRDVEALLHRRRPRVVTDDPHRAWMIEHRALAASYEQIRRHGGGYKSGSGVRKRVNTELRRRLLRHAADLYADDLDELRDAWHSIDLALRRPHLGPADVRDALVRINRVAIDLGLIWSRVNGVERGAW